MWYPSIKRRSRHSWVEFCVFTSWWTTTIFCPLRVIFVFGTKWEGPLKWFLPKFFKTENNVIVTSPLNPYSFIRCNVNTLQWTVEISLDSLYMTWRIHSLMSSRDFELSTCIICSLFFCFEFFSFSFVQRRHNRTMALLERKLSNKSVIHNRIEFEFVILFGDSETLCVYIWYT